jgi:hypothetical protein
MAGEKVSRDQKQKHDRPDVGAYKKKNGRDRAENRSDTRTGGGEDQRGCERQRERDGESFGHDDAAYVSNSE